MDFLKIKYFKIAFLFTKYNGKPEFTLRFWVQFYPHGSRVLLRNIYVIEILACVQMTLILQSLCCLVSYFNNVLT